MFTYESILAAVLITASPNTHSPSDLRGWFEPLQSSVVCLSVEAEILDQREVKFIVAGATDFPGDLKMLQGRFHDLASAPLLEEAGRFAERPMVTEFLAFNRAYRQDICAQLALDLVHADELRLAILETDQLYQIWDTLRDARCEYYYVTVRRQSLQNLRAMLGHERFYRGQMPPHVPVWRFAESKN